MLHLVKYDILSTVRRFETIFWPLIFPLLLATLFYFAFGKVEEADFETVPVAIVREEEPDTDTVFLSFLDSMGQDDSALIEGREMTREEALRALREKTVKGIFYVDATPSLTVGGNGLAESILQSLLENYENGKQTLEQIAGTHPEGMQSAIEQMSDYQELVEQVSLGGRTTNGNMQFFYALVAMACMYGAFIGFGAALTLQANLTSLAARRCVTPTHKLTLIFSEMVSAFILHFINIVILLLYLRYVLKLDFQGQTPEMLLVSLIGCMIGVSLGIFVGSFGKMREGVKIGILLGISMVCSFLAGLMSGQMKYIVEQHVPVINRINPAALISDAFYCINVYNDWERYFRSLATLLVMCVILLAASFCMVRRERYDSI